MNVSVERVRALVSMLGTGFRHEIQLLEHVLPLIMEDFIPASTVRYLPSLLLTISH